jgi:hypothetical protein
VKRIFYFILIILCNSSLFAQDSLTISKGKVDIYIIRNGFTSLTNSLSAFSFYNNDKYIGRLKGFKYLKYECNAGKQLFWGAADNKDFLELDLQDSQVYIIEVTDKMGFYRGQVKLRLVAPDSDEYTFFRNKIEKNDPQRINPKEIEGKNILLKDYILRALTKYEKRKQRELSFKSETIDTPKPIICQTDTLASTVTPIQLDYNFVDFPFSNKSMEISGIKGLITNPSMSQSLNIATSVNSLTREGLYRIMSKHPSTKRYYGLSACFLDLLSILPIPLTSSWMHEESHRAVLAKHGGNSYNEMNDFPIFKSLISVLKVKDEDLIRLKRESPQDMVRMSEAGIEGQYLMSNNINKAAFFNNTKSKSLIPLLSNLNSMFYVLICSGKTADRMTDEVIAAEGNNIAKRDLVGLDFLAYTYDLFRPNEPYESRGIHPSGVGINRYIKRSQLTTEEKSYLKQQGLLQLINLINPISLMLNSFDTGENINGDKTRANLYFNHWLTSFGYDISSTGLLHYNKNNYAFTFHNFVNHAHWMPGVELETYDYMIGRGVIKKPIPVTARVMAWLQPEDQLFFSKNAQLGGLIEAKIQYPLSKYINPYISITAKTAGWVAGNVYLEKNLSFSFGLRASF